MACCGMPGKATLSDSSPLQPTWTMTLGQANPQAKDAAEGLSRVHGEGNPYDEAKHKVFSGVYLCSE